jgi:hypothetical protein
MEFSRLTLLMAGELLIGLSLLSGFLIAFGVIKKNKIRQAAHHLAARVQSDKESRKERLKNRLAGQYRYAGEDLKKAIHDLSQAEMHLYQNIINSYLKQDVNGFQQVGVDVDNLVLAYQGLKLPEAGAGVSSETETAGDEGAEIQRLQDENERLTEELGVTMDTMARMLNEYSSMYAGGADNQLDKGQIMGMLQEGQDVSQEGEETEEPKVETVQQDEQQSAVGEIEIDKASESDTDGDEDSEPGVESDKTILPEVSATSEQVIEVTDKQSQMEDLVQPEPAGEINSDEDSLMKDLEKVAIELPDKDGIATGDETATPGSLEEEWAKLLEEDAESAEKIAQEALPEQSK